MKKILLFIGFVMIIATLAGCKNNNKSYTTIDDFVGEYVSYDANGVIENKGEPSLKIVKEENNYFMIIPKMVDGIAPNDTLQNIKMKISHVSSKEEIKKFKEENRPLESELYVSSYLSLFKIRKGVSNMYNTNFYLFCRYISFPSSNLEKVK